MYRTVAVGVVLDEVRQHIHAEIDGHALGRGVVVLVHKHNNWSISADGKNLFDPGENPMENLRFLVFLTCVIEAVDEYQELLRML